MNQRFSLLLLSFIFISCVAKAADSKKDPVKKDDLTGNVTSFADKKGIKDVVVTAYIASKKEKVVYSGVNGAYNFDDLKPGTYKFVFEKDGYKKVIKEKVIAKVDEGFQMDIEMIREEPIDVMPSPSHYFYN